MSHLRTASCIVLAVLMTSAAACASDSPPATPTDAGTPKPTADAAPPLPDAALPDGAAPDSGASVFPSQTATELQATLDTVAREIAPGAALYVRHPVHGTFSSTAGVANVVTGEALTSSHRFRAGSMLKTLVAVAALREVEAGRLALDQTVAGLLPEPVHSRIQNAELVTVRMLLQHTSGIPEYANGNFDALVFADPTHVWTTSELLLRVEAQEPTGLPGAAWSYSNANYLLLGEILTSVSASPWRQTVASAVLQPLALSQSRLPEPGDASCDECARGYELVDGERFDLSAVDPSMAGAAGGAALITTPEDLAKFVSGLFGDRAFDSAATLSSMLDFTDAELPEEAQTGYGLGITRFQLGDVKYYGHLGGTAGYQGFMLLQPETGMVITGYMNQRGNFAEFLVPVLESLARLP